MFVCVISKTNIPVLIPGITLYVYMGNVDLDFCVCISSNSVLIL